ncbi:MAG: methyltransferase domain-containing protein [bacterium]
MLLGRLLGFTIGTIDRIAYGAAKLMGEPQAKVWQGTMDKLDEMIEQDRLRVIHLGSFTRSLMRSMELSMLWGVKDLLARPLLDLGCGDGLFSALLLPHIEAGIDLDGQVLEKVRPLGVYQELKQADATKHIPFNNAHFGAILANSVVEHIPDTEALLKEASRVLAPGGVFVFTTYTDDFTRYLEHFFGPKEAARINERIYHTSLYPAEKWPRMLEENNLEMIECRRYLPYQTVVMYRLFNSALFKLIEFSLKKYLWRLSRDRFCRLIRDSIYLGEEGCGMLIVAKKR